MESSLVKLFQLRDSLVSRNQSPSEELVDQLKLLLRELYVLKSSDELPQKGLEEQVDFVLEDITPLLFSRWLKVHLCSSRAPGICH